VFLFPARRVQGDVRIPRCLRMASGYPMVAQKAQTNHVGGTPSPVPDRTARQSSGSGRDHHVRRGGGASYPLPLAREQHSHTVDQQRRSPRSRIAAAVPGAPDAMKVARPVRWAGRGNGSGAIPTPRPGPTPTSSPSRLIPRSTPWWSGRRRERCWCTCQRLQTRAGRGGVACDDPMAAAGGAPAAKWVIDVLHKAVCTRL
jgi:hypothetical protein